MDDLKMGRPKKPSVDLTLLPYTVKGEQRLRDRLEREGISPGNLKIP
jgi:hypothetical protein